MSSKLKDFVKFGRTIVGVGRNYRAHASELGNPVPSEPFVFLKPVSSYITQGQPIKLPPGASEIHHEVELGVVIGTRSHCVSEANASTHIGGYFLALDMTDRKTQNLAKEKGLPWTLAKGFDTACPVSDFIPKEKIPDPQNIDLWLKVNGVTRQNANTSLMIFPVNTLISWLSQRMTLDEGDVILTGTPEGVGSVSSGDVIECGLGELIKMKYSVM